MILTATWRELRINVARQNLMNSSRLIGITLATTALVTGHQLYNPKQQLGEKPVKKQLWRKTGINLVVW
jgi:hypothetical protein